jgi:prepilin-type N-terminal cleavage/methylation domain-containing protein
MFLKLNKKFCSERSFTLIETLIVVAILAILTTTAFVELSSFKNRHTLDLDAEEIVSALGNAQSKAMQQEGGDSWGVRFSNSAVDLYQIFKGSSYSASTVVSSGQLSTTDAFTDPAEGVDIDIVFSARTGLPTPATSTAVVIKQLSGDNTYSISVNSAGRISKDFESGD